MNGLLKRVAARLPPKLRRRIRKGHLHRQFLRTTDADEPEPEYHHLPEWVKPGDRAIDVGANIGQYTRKLSELVGKTGRVFAFEPVPETFEILATNMATLPLQNVTLFNAAASDRAGIVGMAMPSDASGMPNIYQAAITRDASGFAVFGFPLDAIQPQVRVSLVKIDAEGHEHSVLLGMRAIMERDHPVLIVECPTHETKGMLVGLGYRVRTYPKSPNVVFSCGTP